MKYQKAILAPLILFLAFPIISSAQLSTSQLKSKLDSSDFTFVANTAIPSTGPVRQLTSPYDVTISNKTLDSHLPYFGIARSAPISPQESGMIFTSSDFEYTTSKKDNDRWNVLIKFKDQREVRTFYFVVFESGTATLTVTGNYRDAISHRGYIK